MEKELMTLHQNYKKGFIKTFEMNLREIEEIFPFEIWIH
jgi:hypothetical protein